MKSMHCFSTACTSHEKMRRDATGDEADRKALEEDRREQALALPSC